MRREVYEALKTLMTTPLKQGTFLEREQVIYDDVLGRVFVKAHCAIGFRKVFVIVGDNEHDASETISVKNDKQLLTTFITQYQKAIRKASAVVSLLINTPDNAFRARLRELLNTEKIGVPPMFAEINNMYEPVERIFFKYICHLGRGRVIVIYDPRTNTAETIIDVNGVLNEDYIGDPGRALQVLEAWLEKLLVEA